MCAGSQKAKIVNIFDGVFQKCIDKFSRFFLIASERRNAYVYQSPVKKSPLARFL